MYTPRGAKLGSSENLLFRQVHPSFVDGTGRPSIQAWRLRPSEDGYLSVSDGSHTTADKAHALYLTQKNSEGDFLRSVGVWAVSCAEVYAAVPGVEALEAYGDPKVRGEGTPPSDVDDPAHALIRLGHLSEKQMKVQRARLHSMANARGARFTPLAEQLTAVGEPEVGPSAPGARAQSPSAEPPLPP
jgi:hypothetical protein